MERIMRSIIIDCYHNSSLHYYIQMRIIDVWFIPPFQSAPISSSPTPPLQRSRSKHTIRENTRLGLEENCSSN